MISAFKKIITWKKTMKFTPENLALITSMLKSEMQKEPGYSEESVNVAISQNEKEDLQINVKESKPHSRSLGRMAIFSLMGIGAVDFTDPRRAECARSIHKEWATGDTEEDRGLEILTVSAQYAEKLLQRCEDKYLRADSVIHDQLEKNTPLIPAVAHEVVGFVHGEGPCARLGNKGPSNTATLVLSTVETPEPRSEPGQEDESGCCAVL
ncbi:hypothetical protein [Piscirickettsia litoralis]|uniref:Uncharacterized protein n=1 Tax=Piscirickettsia litoralis TaxID=1891921 RepID=A0ABX3A1C7_9GAMM|nr:hypothetical protein [Piscirickettsia litoralis]ODN42679.1 hypothetical protein BGC07_06790 [Piscirickettsia litoralis]